MSGNRGVLQLAANELFPAVEGQCFDLLSCLEQTISHLDSWDKEMLLGSEQSEFITIIVLVVDDRVVFAPTIFVNRIVGRIRPSELVQRFLIALRESLQCLTWEVVDETEHFLLQRSCPFVSVH